MEKQLKGYEVSEDVFTELLNTYSEIIHYCDGKKGNGFEKYVKGYKDKNTFILNKDMTRIVCLASVFPQLNEYLINKGYPNYQIVVELNTKLPPMTLQETITGWQAWRYITTLLKEVYTEEEIEQRLNKFSAPFDEYERQIHYFIDDRNTEFENKIAVFNNCYYYDINGAHHDALCTIFPKAKDKLTYLFDKRKENPNYKKYVNYYVGMLCNKGHRETYNWIVQRTTDILTKNIEYVQGKLIYANTDGFIVQNPMYTIKHSTQLGKFKLEYQGPVAVCSSENYQIFQTGKEIKGSMPLNIRNKVNLFNGTTLSYVKEAVKDMNNERVISYTTNNVKIIEKDVKYYD